MQDLDFNGGPWKLRNGEVVDKIDGGNTAFFEELNLSRAWDHEGNGWNINVRQSDFDIMENLDNYKYKGKIND